MNLDDPDTARRADGPTLAAALTALRARTLAQFEALRAALGEALAIPYAETANPPLWELGHVAWFEGFWIGRNSERLRGPTARPEAARAAPWLPNADALYDSSAVAHRRRWQLDLPDAPRTLETLARERERTLALLRHSHHDDDALYFFRWALMHEAMHVEAGLMVAQQLGLAVSEAAPAAAAAPRRPLAVQGATLACGRDDGGFAFDNELGEHGVTIDDFEIDSAPVTWRDLLPFALEHGLPRHLERDDAFEHGVKRAAFGRWVALDLDAPALHLTAHEANAWCAWAGRRLPTEHEWTLARHQHGAAFDCGQVWEWTASAFAPFPGFAPHPYRDYSAPWFDGRPVLKGGSFATPAFLKHPRYRNFFPAERSDVFAGFRSCARQG